MSQSKYRRFLTSLQTSFNLKRARCQRLASRRRRSRR